MERDPLWKRIVPLALSANDVLDVEDASERNIAMYIGLGAVLLIIVLFVLFRGGL